MKILYISFLTLLMSGCTSTSDSLSTFIVVTIGWYPIFLVPALLGHLLPHLIFKNYIKINLFHILNFVIPWGTWVALMVFDSSGKSLSNVAEAALLGFCTAILFAIEGYAAKSDGYQLEHFSKVSIVINSILAYSLWALIPVLPE